LIPSHEIGRRAANVIAGTGVNAHACIFIVQCALSTKPLAQHVLNVFENRLVKPR